jgi:hypothetical protein
MNGIQPKSTELAYFQNSTHTLHRMVSSRPMSETRYESEVVGAAGGNHEITKWSRPIDSYGRLIRRAAEKWITGLDRLVIKVTQLETLPVVGPRLLKLQVVCQQDLNTCSNRLTHGVSSSSWRSRARMKWNKISPKSKVTQQRRHVQLLRKTALSVTYSLIFAQAG